MPLTPLGGVECETGRLGLAWVDSTPFCLLSVEHPQLKAPLTCSLSPLEVETLEALSRQACELLPSVESGFDLVVGQLPARPFSFNVRVVRGPEGAAWLVLTFVDLHRQFGYPCALTPEKARQWLGLVASGRLAGGQAPVAERRVDGLRPGALVLDGEEVPWVDHLSQAVGRFGESLTRVELKPGDRVRAWATPRLLLRAELPYMPEPDEGPRLQPDDVPGFEQLMRQGEESDRLAGLGRLAESARAHDLLVADIARIGRVGPVLAARLALSAIYRHMVCLQLKEAYDLMMRQPEHPLYSPGVQSIEQFAVRPREWILFQLMGGFLCATQKVVEGCLDRLSNACEVALKHEPQLLPLALRNWRLHLMTLFGDEIPPAQMAAWESVKTGCTRPLSPWTIGFPPPGPWVL